MAGVIDLATYAYHLELDDKNFTSGMKNAEEKTETFKGKMGGLTDFLKTSVVAGLAAVGIAAVGMAVKGVGSAGELQKSLNSLQASTGTAKEEMDGMKQSLLNIYNNNFGESFEDISKSMATVKQISGESGKSLEELTQNAIMLKDTFEFEVNESTRSASALMKNFGISGKDAFNIIAQATQLGADKNGDLLDTFNEYSVQFKSLGFNAEQFANILVSGAENGVFSIDKVGDAIKEFNIRAKDGSDTSKQAFSELGFDAEQLSKDFAKGGESAQKSFQKVISALKNVEDPLKQNTLGVALFGTQFEDLEKQGIFAFANISDKVSLTKNALDQINAVKYDTFGEAMTGIGRNLETGILLPIGEEILPILNMLANWINSNMPIIQGIISAAMDGIGFAFDTVSKIVIPLLQEGFRILTETVIPALQGKFNETSNTVVPVLINVFNILKNDVLPSFINVFKSIAETVIPIVSEAFQFISDKILPVVIDIFTFIYTEIVPKLAKSFEEWVPKIMEIMKGLWDIIKMVLDSFMEQVDFVLPYIKTIFTYVFDSISNVVTVFLDILSGLINFIVGVLTGDWERAWKGIEEIFVGIWDGIVRSVENYINYIQGMMENIVGSISKAIDKINIFNRKKVDTKTADYEEYAPSYDVGTPFVPNDQLALIHKGEAIIPAKYNPYNSTAESSIGTTNNINVNVSLDGASFADKKDIDYFTEQLQIRFKQSMREVGVRGTSVFT